MITQNAALVMLRNAIDIPKDLKSPIRKRPSKWMSWARRSAIFRAPTVERIYVGPKILKILETVPVTGLPADAVPDLHQLMDFGFFGLISRPLFVWLRWTYEHIGSQLGMGDRHPDPDHQPGAVAAAHLPA